MKNPLPASDLAVAPLTTTRLKVIKGPHKGMSYKIVAGKITIGRSSENDISLAKDDKCSRKQAILSKGADNNYTIKDLSGRASLKVNNLAKIQSDLQDGDLIQFGCTVLQFEHSDPSADAPAESLIPPAGPGITPLPPAGLNPLPSVNNPHLHPLPTPADGGSSEESTNDLPDLAPEQALPTAPPLNQGFPPSPDYSPPPPLSSSQKPRQKKPLLPKIILLLLVVGGGWLFLSDDSADKKEKADKLKTILEREEDVKTLTELKEKEQEKRQKNSLSSYKNAQFAYVKGVRDYRKGVYSRAIESFRVCKTLYPQHELCATYLKKAQVKNQQLIQAWMVAGKDYREKRRFVPCMSSFKNVMMAIKDKQNITYKEARENYKICLIQHEDRY